MRRLAALMAVLGLVVPAAAGLGPSVPAAAGLGPSVPAAAGLGPSVPAAAGLGPSVPAAARAGVRASTDPVGNVRVFALIPHPGYPALPHVLGNRVFEGTYDNPFGDPTPSEVFEFDLRGRLLRTFVVRGQDVHRAHGVQVAANDSRGRLLLLDKDSGRIIRLDPRTGRQTLYGRVAYLPRCTDTHDQPPCKPTLEYLPPMPDYAAWGPDGSLYVTDYQQAVIWRVPPGGGAARVWFASRVLDGTVFGTACMTLLPDHRTLLFDQASNGGLGAGNPTTGKLYTVAIGPGGHPAALHRLWESGPADAPDGCVVARSGHIYIALVGGSNQIIELDARGHELARFGQQFTGTNNSAVPFDSPSGLAWLGTRLLVANQSYFADNPANQALLALQAGERGVPAFVPRGAGTRVTSHP